MKILTVSKYILLTSSLVLLGFSNASSQNLPDTLIHFSGLVLDNNSDNLLPIPYTNVYAKEDVRRGVSTDQKGFFNLVVAKGETIIFSAIGYKEMEIVVPDTLSNSSYSIVQLMSRDTIFLPETIVYPWPSLAHVNTEMITPEMQRRADKNLAFIQNILKEERDAAVASGKSLKIFDPTEWGKFFKSWKKRIFNKEKSK